MITFFAGKPCGFFEAQFFRCLEAYGAKLGRKYCDLEHRDYQECLTGDKQVSFVLFCKFSLRFYLLNSKVTDRKADLSEQHIYYEASFKCQLLLFSRERSLYEWTSLF